MKRYKVIEEHPILKERFPLGYERNFYNTYREEEVVIPAYFVETSKKQGYWVKELILPKGEFLDIIFIDIDGAELSSTLIYQWTGKHVGDLFENLSVQGQ